MWYKIENDCIYITVWVKPNAKNTRLLNMTDEALHIALHAKPKQGEANMELIAFISLLFKVPKTHIYLIRGETGRKKLLSLPISSSLMESINTLKSQLF